MHYCLVTYGSRGDIQPFIALALGLMAKGHQVTLAAPGNFKQLVEGYGVTMHPLHGNVEEIVNSPEGQKVIRSGSDTAFMREMLKKVRAMQLPLFDDIYQACKTADVIIAVNTAVFYVDTIAEKLGKKWLIVQLNPPMIPTKAFPMQVLNMPDMGWLNRYTYHIINGILWRVQKKDVAVLRQRVNLPPLKGPLFKKILEAKVPMIHAFSDELITRPADWNDEHSIAGFFTAPEVAGHKTSSEIRLQYSLDEWLQAGEKPLYIGFGSIPFPDNEKLAGAIKGIMAGSNTRIIYCQGWSQLPDLPANPDLFVIKQADHQWLLPQCSAALVHGGIGTVAAVLRAGIPAIVASIFVDQPVWGKIIQQKNLGFHISWRKLSAATILDALHKVKEAPVVTTLPQVQARLLKENGVETAIATIEAYSNR
jgi:sterol 3beta-glucosyltransferase